MRGLTTDTDDAAIVEAVIRVGHGLHLNVMALGSETDEQLDILANFDREEAQSYLVGKPVSPEQFTNWIEAHHRVRTV